MSAPTLAIRARHAARRRHSASIRDLRADRHPNEPHSGPLRPLRAVGGTLGHPLDRPSMALGRGGPACISPAAGLQRPVLDAVSTARRWSAPRTIRLTYRLCRQDCSLCDGVTNRRSYPSTKPGQLHLETVAEQAQCLGIGVGRRHHLGLRVEAVRHPVFHPLDAGSDDAHAIAAHGVSMPVRTGARLPAAGRGSPARGRPAAGGGRCR